MERLGINKRAIEEDLSTGAVRVREREAGQTGAVTRYATKRFTLPKEFITSKLV